MAINTSETEINSIAVDCAERLKILADPTRMRIVRALTCQPSTVSELLTDIAIPQNLMSHHLKVLREGGILSSKREGKSIRYALSERVIMDDGDEIDLGCCQLHFGYVKQD